MMLFRILGEILGGLLREFQKLVVNWELVAERLMMVVELKLIVVVVVWVMNVQVILVLFSCLMV